ncbi:MAG: hypothetical protein P9L90_03665 [Candidatus Aadella gelida]|nr:hypothetical protein [Candidatus Aadella gelida]
MIGRSSGRNLFICMLSAGIVLCCMSITVKCSAQEVDMSRSSYDAERGERTVNGLKFFIAEDRRMVSNGQYIEPETLDKYLGRKFDKMYEMFDNVASILSRVEERLSKLESSVDKLSQQTQANTLQSGEEINP